MKKSQLLLVLVKKKEKIKFLSNFPHATEYGMHRIMYINFIDEQFLKSKY